MRLVILLLLASPLTLIASVAGQVSTRILMLQLVGVVSIAVILLVEVLLGLQVKVLFILMDRSCLVAIG